MDAKRCDQCGAYYQDLREPAAIATVDVFEDQRHQPIKVQASFLPLGPDGVLRDLCKDCRAKAVEAVLHNIAREKFGLELNQIGAVAGWQKTVKVCSDENSRLVSDLQIAKEANAVLELALAAERKSFADLVKRHEKEEIEAAQKAAKKED
jgi:hypothetical protein